jgi:homoserine kinase
MIELLQLPIVRVAIGVVIAILAVLVYKYILKKDLKFETAYSAISRVIELILGAAGKPNALATVATQVARLPQAELAVLSKTLATDQPREIAQKVYDQVTEPYRQESQKKGQKADGSKFIEGLASGAMQIGGSAVSGLAAGLAKKWF